ncbi:pharyngeal muscle protein 2-like [Hermetia illucens]|nr:pharyngeal muscle protein 2-like [Hermetia illucens]
MPRDIYSLKVSELKAELAKRGLPTRGNKASLLAELIEALTNEGFDPDTYEFPEAKELSDDSETEQSPEQAPTKTDKIMEMLSAMTSTMN